MIKKIYIEITNICNLKCSFCSPSERVKKEMSLNDFEYIVIEAKKHTDFIYLHVKGEPLLHSKFEEILHICDKYEMKVQLTTNATLLHKYPNILEHTSIRKMSLSLHAYDEINYNINDLIATIETLISKLNDSQYLELRFWNKDNLQKNALTIIEHFKSNYQLEPTKSTLSYKIKNNVYLNYDIQFTWPKDAINKSNKGKCNGVKNMLAILVDGSITPCCLDDDASIYLGNIHQISIEKVLNSDKYLTMMYNISRGILIEKLCINCTFRQRFE